MGTQGLDTIETRGGGHKNQSHQTKLNPYVHALRRVTRIGRALVCQPPAAPAASSSPCSTLSCRTFSDLVGCHQAAPQAVRGGTAAPLSCGPWHQQHLQPRSWEEAHKVFKIQRHAGKNQKVKKPSHLSFIDPIDAVRAVISPLCSPLPRGFATKTIWLDLIRSGTPPPDPP